MNTSMIIEMIGYLGSALVVVSMLMSSVIKLRVINTIGSCIFAGYALIIHSYPTAIMNFCLVAINVYNLMKLLKSNQQYNLIEGAAGDSFVEYFLDYYKEDIRIYFPQFKWEPSLYDAVYIVCCNANPAGLLLGQKKGANEIEISLEYTTPTYRDCSVGTYLYDELSKKEIRRLSFKDKAEKHEAYLQKMGYSKAQGAYVKEFI